MCVREKKANIPVGEKESKSLESEQETTFRLGRKKSELQDSESLESEESKSEEKEEEDEDGNNSMDYMLDY